MPQHPPGLGPLVAFGENYGEIVVVGGVRRVALHSELQQIHRLLVPIDA